MGLSFVLAVIVVFIMICSYLLIKMRKKNVQKNREAHNVEQPTQTTNSNW